MKVIITGARGLLGKAFQDVVNEEIEHVNDTEFVFLGRSDCDLRDRIDVMRVFQEVVPDVVVHFASHVGGVYDNLEHNYTYLMDNVKIHTNMIEACHEVGVARLVNVLSTCIFPDADVTYPLSSDQLHNGLPHFSNMGYAYSKRFLHIASEVLATRGKTSVVNIIPTNLYGENDNYDLERAHVIPALIHKAYLARLNNEAFRIRGSGQAVRQFLYAKDLARIVFTCMTKNFGSESTTFIASPPSSTEMRISEVVEIIRETFGIAKENVVYESSDTDGQHRKTTTDSELRRHFPDFKFTDFTKGIKNVIEFFQKHYAFVRK